MQHPKNKEGRLLVKQKRNTRGKECKEIIHEHFPKLKEVVFQIKGSTSHPTVQRFLKRNTMKFQMVRVKEETLDDSRKKTRFHKSLLTPQQSQWKPKFQGAMPFNF